MRNCHQAGGLFGAYWDGETTVAEREWLDSHFKTCTRCREGYEQLATTLGAVSELPRHETRPDFTQRVLVAARQASVVADRIRVVPGRTGHWVPIATAATLVLVAAVSLMNVFGPRGTTGALAGNEATLEAPVPGSAEQVAATIPPSLDAVTAPRVTGAAAMVTDSLFDHTADVEFMLEPVQLRRGRAHTGSRLPDGVQGDQVVITF